MKRKELFMILLALLLMGACNRKKESIGPLYYLASENFSVTSFEMPDTVNFLVLPFALEASFSEKVTWNILIEGDKSGAIRHYSGSSKNITAEEFTWDGSHEDLYFFRKGETATITLSFMGSDIKKTGKVLIKKVKDYSANGRNVLVSYNSNNGYEDDPIGTSFHGKSGHFPSQFGFNSCGDSNIVDTYNLLKTVEGEKYLVIEGTSCDPDGYFVAALQHRQKNFFFPSWSDPNQIYFNIFVYGTGDPLTKINLEFQEADPETDALKSSVPQNSKVITCPNQPYKVGEHCPCVDDAWVAKIETKHVGWKMFSIRYSDFIRSTVANNGSAGNKRIDATRVHRIQVGVISDPAKNPVKAIWDFPIISYGGPFDPTK